MISDGPNILFILADDLGWGDVGYHGSAIRTPNIDRLVEGAVELDQHYVQPMCTPTRTALLTGRYPGRFGAHATVPTNSPVLPDGYETLATSLRNAGYDTGLFGKWHLGSSPQHAPNRYGFNASYGSLAGGVDPYNHRYKTGRYSRTWHRNGELVEERGHVTDLIVNEAVSWIESRREPWFCYVPFTAVHVPVKAPHQWLATYESGSYDDDPGKDRSYKDYAAYASHMDDAVGRLLEALMRVDQLQNTIVVFSSDNGAQRDNSSEQAALYPGLQEANLRLGSNLPLRGHKAQLYEGGIRTPSLISWPGALEPGKVSAPMHIVDWMPTLTRLIGYEPGDDPLWDGVDIWSVLASERNRGGEDRTISWNFRNSNFAVRRGDWKLITRETDGGWGDTQLYDLGSDPHETADLASKHPEMVSQLLRIVMESRELDGASARPGAPTNAGSPIFVGGPDPGSR